MFKIGTKNLRGDSIPYLLLIAAAVFSVWLASENRQLRTQLLNARQDLRYAKVGDWLPVTELTTLQDRGREVRLGAPEKDFQIVYFYSPSCAYCEASSPHVRRLYQRLKRSDKVEMIAASVAGDTLTKKHFIASKSEIPTVVLPGERERWVYKLARVPALVVVDKGGRVKFIHYGLISDKEVPMNPNALVPIQGS